jgi:hypothetical protein
MHWLAHLFRLNTGTVVAEWRLATLEFVPMYYAVAVGFKCSHCGKVTGWHLTKNTMPLDQFPRSKGTVIRQHEL